MGAETETVTVDVLKLWDTSIASMEVGKDYELGDVKISAGTNFTYDSSGKATAIDTVITYDENGKGTAVDGTGEGLTYNIGKFGAGSGSPKPAEGTGRFISITPEYDGKLQLVVKVNNGKQFVVETLNGTIVNSVLEYTNNSGSNGVRVFKEIPVKAGETYYTYSPGGGSEWYSIAYTYEREIKKEPDNPGDVQMVTKTEDVLKEWTASAMTEKEVYQFKGMDISAGTNFTYDSSGKATAIDTVITYDENGKGTAVDGTGDELTYNIGKFGAGSGSPKPAEGTGRFISITPKYDGKLQLVVKVNNGKQFVVETLDGTIANSVLEYTNNSGSNGVRVFKEIPVKAGKTYYTYSPGGGSEWYSIALTYECEKEEESDPPVDPPTTDKVPAFPGAEGGGKYTTGGRGKTVYTVTNLLDQTGKTSDDCIEGSLRWALFKAKENGGGTIVFNVSGNIELEDTLEFKDISNVTIAGQTAPGDGITVSGFDTCLSNSNNIIIRYMRFRPGAINVHSGGDSMDSLWGRDNKNFVIDHCSFSWNTDECLSIYRGQDGTVQWSLVYESLTLSGHSKGRHGYGAIAGGDNVTFHHNLYADHTSRNPRLGGGYGGAADAKHVAVVQMNDNVIYNWGFNTTYGGGYANTNFINNYEMAGPGTRDSVANWVINPGEKGKVGGFYIKNNYLTDYLNRENGEKTPLITMDNISDYGSFSGEESGSNKSTLAEVPYYSKDGTGDAGTATNDAFDEYLNTVLKEEFNPEETLQEVLTKAGATYPRRDAIDARITAEVENQLGRYVNTEHEAGGFLSESGVIVEQHKEGYDTDGDGMPDDWEENNGLDKNDPADGSKVSDTLSMKWLKEPGYTNLEVYLNSIVDMDHVPENPVVEMTTPSNNQMIQKGTDITLTVDASGSKHEIQKADFYYSTLTERTYIGEGTVNGTTITCTLPELPDGSYFVSARVYDAEGNSTQTTPHEIHINTSDTELKEAGWTSADIGEVDVAGYGSLEDGVLTVKGNGKLGKAEGTKAGVTSEEIASAATDACHYVYKKYTGDVEITAKLEFISSVDNHAFAGIMIREDLDKDSAAAVLGLSWAKTEETIGIPWAMYLASRDKKGGNFNSLAESLDDVETAKRAGVILQTAVPFKDGPEELGYWMRLIRRGDEFTAYSSADGVVWKLMGSKTIPMGEEVYIGFAADSNRVANDMEQINTARFSNIKVSSNICNVIYDMENIGVTNKVDTVTTGNDISVILTTTKGYRLPKTVQVTVGDQEPIEIALDLVDPLEGNLLIENVTGQVTISAKAEIDTEGIEQVALTKIDEKGYLTVTASGSAIILDQSATDGRITKQVGENLAKNVSYYVFPKTTDAQTMEMDVTILGRQDDESKDRGFFVGVFEIGNGEEEFSSLGFRNVSGTPTEMGGLTAYFTKSGGNTGNAGSSVNNGLYKNDQNSKPSYEIGKTYHIIFEKTGLGYKVSWTGTYAEAGSGVYPNGNSDGPDMDLYYVFSDKRPAASDEVQYGFALTGVTAQIENLTLTDSRGRTIYKMTDDEIKSIGSLADVEIDIPEEGLTKEAILAELPTEVRVMFMSDSYQVRSVTWDLSELEELYTKETKITVSGTIDGVDDYTASVNIILKGNATEDPTEPSNPDDPTEPSNPDDPTEPSNPDDPTEPSNPDDPTEPSNPDDPTEPSNPEEPTEPSDPDDPTQPSNPDDPIQPSDPEEPTQPSDPEDPTQPSDPEEPSKPDRPSYDEDEDDDDEEESTESDLTDREQNRVEEALGSSVTVQDVVESENGKLVISVQKEIVFCEKDGTLSKDKWQKVNGSWYYFGSDSKAVDGWLKTGDKWYYMDQSDKKMETGWLKTGDGKWYLLDEVNGDMKTGWQQKNGKWYLLDGTNGDMKIGWQLRGDKWYLLDSINGDMKTGWQLRGGKWYLLDSINGDMKIGWQLRGGKWYYLTASGAMAANMITPDGYQVDSSGAWIR